MDFSPGSLVSDAQPLESYADWLAKAGFSIAASGARNDCLATMVEQIRSKLLLADIMVGLKKLELPGLDIQQAKQFASAARDALKQNKLGYALVVGELVSA